MSEHDESLIQTDASATDESHLCMDPSMCVADQSEEHLISPSTVSPTLPLTSGKKMRFAGRHVALLVCAVFFLGVGMSTSFVYTHEANDRIVRIITDNIPFPAVLVGREIITYRAYHEEERAIQSYFSSGSAKGTPAPTGDVLQNMILQTLVNKAVVKKYADDFGVRVNAEQVDTFYKNFLTSNVGQSDETLAKQLRETFGWSTAEFKHRVIEPIVLSNAVSDYMGKSAFFQEPPKKEIDEAYKRVTSGGEDFEKVATEVHDRLRVLLKSDLGFMKKSDLPPSWGDKVQNLQNGQVSEIVELPQGYALFKVSDRIKSTEPTKKGNKNDTAVGQQDEQLHLYALTVPKKTLDQLVQAYVQAHPPKVFMKS